MRVQSLPADKGGRLNDGTTQTKKLTAFFHEISKSPVWKRRNVTQHGNPGFYFKTLFRTRDKIHTLVLQEFAIPIREIMFDAF